MRKIWLVLAISLLALSVLEIGATSYLIKYPYSGSYPTDGLFNYSIRVPVVWEYETGQFLTAYSPEVISPTNEWYDPVQQYVYKDGAVGVDSGYNVAYDIKTVVHYVLTGTIHSKVVTRKFNGPGPQ